MPDNPVKFVFIVTYGRSGSTVLQKLLQSIDGYFIRGENNHTLYPLFLAYKRAFEARHTHGEGEPGEDNPWYGANEIRPGRFSKALCDVFLREIIQPPEEARVVGFKEIRFHEAGADLFEEYLNFIANRFPGSRFIFNSRDWQSVAKSSWWASMDKDRVREIIEGCDSLYAAYAKKYPAICHQMKYEDFKGKPAAFKTLFEFLDEPFNEDQVAAVIGQKLTHAERVEGTGPNKKIGASPTV